MAAPRTDPPLGLGCAALGAVALVLWIPADVETGVIDVWRRQVSIGDAMLPTVAAAGLLVSGAVTAVFGAKAPRAAISKGFDLAFPVAAALILSVALALMTWSGPAALVLFGPEDATYRQLRDTAPWKHVGFALGGTALVFGFVSLATRRVEPRGLLWGLLACAALIAIFDLPFDDLLLPPNGDW